ncbi:adenylate cyclase type 9-like, partial [Sinocyclocheilus grahami]|uniref:adenylate cyclase type 9-like n=1 Tax=Sinocyclocheilus grahami TaxID=75366 RepID=UPI0007AC92ED
MASPQHQHLLFHNSEVSCDSSGDGAVSVRISGTKPHKQQRGSLGASAMCSIIGGSKHCKYSISSSCSSGETAIRKAVVKGLRTQRKMPQLFERSVGHFWNPKFDSNILEEACRERCFPQTQRRFRCVLLYLVAASLLWGLFFIANANRCERTAFLLPTASFLLLCSVLFVFTFTRFYVHCYNQASLLLIVVTFALTLAPQIQTPGFSDFNVPPLKDEEDTGNFNGTEDKNLTSEVAHSGGPLAPCLSPVGTFSLGMEVLSLLYSFLHVRLYASLLLGLLYSVLFETLGWMHLIQGNGWRNSTEEHLETLYWLIPGRAILHLCAH